MKQILFSRFFRLLIVFTLLITTVQAADYYVVIGTFADESNARKFGSKVADLFKEVSYTFNTERAVYYVHVLKTSLRHEAEKKRLHLKERQGYKDAWIYTVANKGITTQVVSVPEEVTARYRKTGASGPILASAEAGGNFLSYGEKAATESAVSELGWRNQWGVDFIPDIRDPQKALASKEIDVNNIFRFVVETPEGKEIPAEVMLVDFQKIKKIAAFQTGQHAAIRGTRREQMVTLVCDVLGYDQETRMYNIDHLSRGKDIRKHADGIWEVRFKLKPMKKHDIAYLNRTAFYEDAAILQPSSRSEMDELLALMRKNPEYNLIIHSHCNPGKKEIRLPETTSIFFDIGKSVSKTASGEKLTRARATTMKNYLVAHGIDAKRVSVVGWGSRELLVASTHPEAAMNERVEFEITD